MDMTQRRGSLWDVKEDRLSPEDIFQIRRSGLLLILSTLIQLFALLIFILIPELFNFTYFVPYAVYIFVGTAFCAGILQLAVLLTGMKSLTSFTGSGQGFLWLAVIALTIATTCIPLSLFFFSEGPIWFILGVIGPPSTLGSDVVFLIWRTVIALSLAGYSISFGYLLIKSDGVFRYGDLITTGVFLLIQASLQVASVILANLNRLMGGTLSWLNATIGVFWMIFAVLVNVIWFLYLGNKFRYPPITGEGDAWDRFRRRLSESPSVQGFLTHKMLGVIALILAVIVTIEVLADSILQFWYFGSLWWLAAIAIILGFSSLKFEHANGYAITALGLASLCWIGGLIIAIQINYYL
ncbi:MAG: hypothetical protein LUQ65_03420 [Candidatus Helarchaeota archaeon]|nr:hypothetical protein [Candidatus Helarchaeota archaeon]